MVRDSLRQRREDELADDRGYLVDVLELHLSEQQLVSCRSVARQSGLRLHEWVMGTLESAATQGFPQSL